MPHTGAVHAVVWALDCQMIVSPSWYCRQSVWCRLGWWLDVSYFVLCRSRRLSREPTEELAVSTEGSTADYTEVRAPFSHTAVQYCPTQCTVRQYMYLTVCTDSVAWPSKALGKTAADIHVHSCKSYVDIKIYVLCIHVHRHHRYHVHVHILCTGSQSGCYSAACIVFHMHGSVLYVLTVLRDHQRC